MARIKINKARMKENKARIKKNQKQMKENQPKNTDSFIGFKKVGLASLLTILFGVFIYQMQLAYDKMTPEQNIFKAAIWLAIVLFGSFNYDIFKTVVFMKIVSFEKFKRHIWAIGKHTFGIYVCTFGSVILFDGDAFSQLFSIALFFMIFVFMGYAISNFGQALDVIEDQE